ncbi:uncharacterized protein zgc:174945 [Puntigrus tetrazona]|uniref:uncharacterized protein zgc:174945 n=1 Tax=Puntigrus tetrazona TaxID=1606681 RepID=UPI001C88FCA6|nr:uncharacterized protein zgc:174945 [Puntigrus tetrazona]
MQLFHPTTAFLVFVLCSELKSLAMVVVKYPREPVTKAEGLSMSLMCTVEYEREDCDIEAKWWYTNSTELLPIMDPNAFLITVNETKTNELRLRKISLTIRSLKLQDSGLYQCDAKCLNSGTQAKGHLVNVTVTADPYKGMKVSTWSGQLKADAAALICSAILLLLRCY